MKGQGLACLPYLRALHAQRSSVFGDEAYKSDGLRVCGSLKRVVLAFVGRHGIFVQDANATRRRLGWGKVKLMRDSKPLSGHACRELQNAARTREETREQRDN